SFVCIGRSPPRIAAYSTSPAPVGARHAGDQTVGSPAWRAPTGPGSPQARPATGPRSGHVVEQSEDLAGLFLHQRLVAAALDVQADDGLGVRGAQVEAPVVEFDAHPV